MVYKIIPENVNKYSEANFEDYKDRLVYKLFKKYKKIKEFYDILKVRKHIDRSFFFFKDNRIKQLKNIEFWIETEFIVGFDWYAGACNSKLLDKVNFSQTKFGELNFTDENFELFENFYNEIVKDDYSKFELLFKNLNNNNFDEYYKKEFPNLSSYIELTEFNVRNIQYADKNFEKLFFSFLRNDQWLVG